MTKTLSRAALRLEPKAKIGLHGDAVVEVGKWSIDPDGGPEPQDKVDADAKVGGTILMASLMDFGFRSIESRWLGSSIAGIGMNPGFTGHYMIVYREEE